MSFTDPHRNGFTLLEVVVALSILAISLGILLTTQSSSLANAGKARDTTIAALLARSKMIDIEQQLFDDGFVAGDKEEEGDFAEEGHETYLWKAKISEIELDLSGLLGLCGSAGGDETAATDCESLFGSFGGLLDGFVGDFARSLRLVELTVSWPVGAKYRDSFSVKAVVGKEDYSLDPASTFNPGLSATSASP